MTPLTDSQEGISVAQWVESLPPMEARQLVFLAVINHPVKFTNTQEVADKWYTTLSDSGFNALCKHAKRWLAQEFLKLHEACSA